MQRPAPTPNSLEFNVRKTGLTLAFCLAALPAFAAPPSDDASSLKPGASDLTGPTRGVHPVNVPGAKTTKPVTKASSHKTSHAKPPPSTPN